MHEIRSDIAHWFNEGSRVALAQVVKTWGSSPRGVGSTMAISSSGQMAGSVSGGCIESAVIQIALECLETGVARRERFRASTKRAQELGLSCGGNIEVLIAPLDRPLFETENRLVQSDCEYIRLSVWATADAHNKAPSDKRVLGSSFLLAPEGQTEGCLPNGTSCDMNRLASRLWPLSRSQKSGFLTQEGIEYFYVRKLPRPLLVCVGGVHIAIHLATLAKALGYRTVIVDPRSVFSTRERFPFVDELIHAWPQKAFQGLSLNAASAVCALTHDPKIDVPALSLALDSPAFYIGSLGRYSTQLSRYTQLQKLGYGDSALSRVSGPIGLDLGARDPAEIALSVMAEITAVQNGKAGTTATLLSSAKKAREEQRGECALAG